jgi:hypothetical protein
MATMAKHTARVAGPNLQRWARETIRKHDEVLAIRLDRIVPLADQEPIKIKPRPKRVVR